jgi:hypothetical protein
MEESWPRTDYAREIQIRRSAAAEFLGHTEELEHVFVVGVAVFIA